MSKIVLDITQKLFSTIFNKYIFELYFYNFDHNKMFFDHILPTLRSVLLKESAFIFTLCPFLKKKKEKEKKLQVEVQECVLQLEAPHGIPTMLF